jgi:hypothetical protein
LSVIGGNPLSSIRHLAKSFEKVALAENRETADRISGIGGDTMAKFALWVVVECKTGKEKELEEFLKSAQPLAEREPGTLTWHAVKLGACKIRNF